MLLNVRPASDVFSLTHTDDSHHSLSYGLMLWTNGTAHPSLDDFSRHCLISMLPWLFTVILRLKERKAHQPSCLNWVVSALLILPRWFDCFCYQRLNR